MAPRRKEVPVEAVPDDPPTLNVIQNPPGPNKVGIVGVTIEFLDRCNKRMMRRK